MQNHLTLKLRDTNTVIFFLIYKLTCFQFWVKYQFVKVEKHQRRNRKLTQSKQVANDKLENGQFFKMADTLSVVALKFDVSSMKQDTQTSKSSTSNMFLKTMTLSCFFLLSLSTQSSNLEKKFQMLIIKLVYKGFREYSCNIQVQNLMACRIFGREWKYW